MTFKLVQFDRDGRESDTAKFDDWNACCDRLDELDEDGVAAFATRMETGAIVRQNEKFSAIYGA
jgi:hypothetical protein